MNECPHGYPDGDSHRCALCRRAAQSHLTRIGSPATSARAVESLDVGRLEQLIAEAIHAAGPAGMTADELMAVYPKLSYSSVTARPAALKEKGLVFDSGRTRPGRSGRQQTVLVHWMFK